jgi:Tfp pilus assembly protein PilV
MLIAIVILSVSLLAIAGLMSTTTRNNAFGGHLTEAAQFAEDLSDRLESSKITTTYEPGSIKIPGSDTVTGSTNISYNRAWTGNVYTQPDGTRFWEIYLTIGWTDTIDHQLSFPPQIIRR